MVYQFNPLGDGRWPRFVQRHPEASIFHTPEWLEALVRTHGYEPVVFTTTPPGRELNNGMVFCWVRSWLTGRRLVSLPFSDHCQPLVEDRNELANLLQDMARDGEKMKSKYVEIRPLQSVNGCESHFDPAQTFCYHQLDLRIGRNKLFQGFHKNSIQRKIRRARREGLTVEQGHTERLLNQFYLLLLRTRRRHRLPPQPRNWFGNLVACFGDRLTIWVASKDSRPVTSILTLSFGDTLVYKYGCSDERFHKLGGMPLLLGTTIEVAQKDGLCSVDLGRSSLDNPGLITFKDHLGATRSQVTYLRWQPQPVRAPKHQWEMRIARQVLARVPDPLLTSAGNLLYRHIG